MKSLNTAFSFAPPSILSLTILLAVCILGSAQLFFIGLLGEYVMSMNKRIMNRPLVIEEERLNFTEEQEDKSNA